MRIGIDARALSGTTRAGIYNYVHNLLMELQKIDNHNPLGQGSN